ncbi:SatD family protein [Coraliomargarita sp. W4R53]
MPKPKRKHAIIIGDLIDSKKIENRAAFQKQLKAGFEEIDAGDIASPYTITLGDEFQAVYFGGRGLLRSLFAIRALIHPHQCRFSIAFGEITTEINPSQSIGMDGPAFHQAREEIERMKKSDDSLRINGLPNARLDRLYLPMINLLWESTLSWNANRLKILLQSLRGTSADPVTYDLNITDRAISKNIREARLQDWKRLILEAEEFISETCFAPN